MHAAKIDRGPGSCAPPPAAPDRPGAAAKPQAAPARAGVAPAPAPVPEASPEQTALASDLHWLIHEGHVIEFANGMLDTAKKPVIKPPKPQAKPAAPAAPVAPAPAMDSTTGHQSGAQGTARPTEAETPAPEQVADVRAARRGLRALPKWKRPRRPQLRRRLKKQSPPTRMRRRPCPSSPQPPTPDPQSNSLRCRHRKRLEAPTPFPTMAFTTFGLSPAILQGVKAMGYIDPTPDSTAHHPARSCRDGTSSAAPKPAPAKPPPSPCRFSRCSATMSQKRRCLVLEPTRELAAQVETAIHDFARFTNLRTAVLYGGVGYGKQWTRWARGRTSSWPRRAGCSTTWNAAPAAWTMSNTWCWTRRTGCWTWDFCRTCGASCKNVPRERHTSLFSATIPPEIATLVQWAMRNPETVEIGAAAAPAETVSHVIYPVAEGQKAAVAARIAGSTEIRFRHHFLPHQTRRRPHRQLSSNAIIMPSPSCIPTARKENARTPQAASARDATKPWSPPTSPRADWTSPMSAMSSITTCRNTRRTTSIASAAPGAPSTPATP